VDNLETQFSPAKVFQQAFDEAPIGIAVVSGEGQWLYVNEELCRIFGYAPSEIQKRTWRELTYDADIEPDQQEVDKCRKRNGSDGYSMEKRYRRKNANEAFWASLVVSVVRNDDGEFENFISYVVPCARPAATVIGWAWALKNWKPIGSAVGSALVFLCWAFGWITDEKFEALKKLFL
jgi:PAS domain S-box-containing protein